MNKRSVLLRFLAFLCVVSLLAPAAFAAQQIPPEVKSYVIKFFNEYGNATKTMADRVQKTDDPEQIAGALDKYVDTVAPLMKGMDDLQKKYKDFFESMEEEERQDSGDADIDKANAEFEKTQQGMMDAMQKIASHMEHPKVEAAMERLEKIMSDMDETAE